MKPFGCGVDADAAYYDSYRVNNDCVLLQLEYQPPLTTKIGA